MSYLAALPRLFVRIEDGAGYALAYKPDRSGARWRGGFKDMTGICHDADKSGVPAHCEIVFEEQGSIAP